MSSQRIALVQFGSRARGDADQLSDRDVLIVCARPNEISDYVWNLKAAGWSPTVYSWSRLRAAISRGDLFIQHLRQEGKIIVDPEHRFEDELSAYRPRFSYRPEREASGRLLGILEYLPSASNARLWAFDVASVAFRSLAVAELAENGIYAFASRDLVKGLRRLGIATPELFAVVSELRRGKISYRRRICEVSTRPAEIETLVDVVDSCFKIGIHSKTISSEDFVTRVLCQSHESPDWYAQSRLIELALSMLHSSDQSGQSRLEVWKGRLQAPSEYAAYLSSQHESIAHQLKLMLTRGIVRLRNAA